MLPLPDLHDPHAPDLGCAPGKRTAIRNPGTSTSTSLREVERSMTTVEAPERAHTIRTEPEALDDGAQQRLAALAAEPRDRDPFVAGMQDDRDRLGARGDLERAWDTQCGIEDLRHANTRLRQIERDDVEQER